ncbi:diguanylate cyclase (plasmid) [Deinococcus radiomollis]|uniref:HD domain-containing phosphohydrolase n=1 Tax=Deinococcus radiomollis TaxID=468916 RepID=UPI0038916D29
MSLRIPDVRRTSTPTEASRLNLSHLTSSVAPATLYTALLTAAVITTFLSFNIYPPTLAPDRFQATLRLLSIFPLLLLTFSTLLLRSLAPRGVCAGVLLFASSTVLWTANEAANQYYGLNTTDERFKTAMMLLGAMGLLLTTLRGAHSVYRSARNHRRQVQADPLTGLMRRDGFLKRYQDFPSGVPCSVAVFDLNQLKSINDTHGHSEGDAYIRTVARALRSGFPERALLCRWGGDEFAAVIPGMPEVQVTKRIRKILLNTPRVVGDAVAFAYGTAPLTSGEGMDRALALADQRMHERKEEQRATQTVIYPQFPTDGEVARHLEHLGTSNELLTRGVALVAHLLHFEGTFYMQRQEDSWVVTRLHFSVGQSHPLHEGLTQSLESGLVGRAYRTQTPIWSTDYPSDPDASPAWVEAGLKTTLITPVRCRNDIIGFICLCSFSTWRSITPKVRRTIETIALRLGHVLDLERVEQDVRATLEGGLLGLGAALEARDLETGGHTRRVVGHATRLGKALGLPDDALDALRQGAYLHDIGKLVIPDSILLKPGKLTPEEWEIMKTHASRGSEIAQSIPTLAKGALDVIRHHHERWDGTGYPDALRHEDIPLPARIFAVCDVYDALTNARSYKQAWPQAEAKAELARQAGKHFDPEVVHAFLTAVTD